MIIGTAEKTTLEEIKFPPIVYKYRKAVNPIHRTIITNQEIYFAPPNSFLDKFDCKNPIRYDLLSEKEVYNEYFKIIKQENPSWNRTEIRRNAKLYSKEKYFQNKGREAILEEKFWKMFNERFGVFCLTWNNASTLMWNEYSDNYNGFCVGFNSKILFNQCGGGGTVHYTEALPIIMPSDSYEEKFTKQIFFKLKNFEYEQEYRTIQMWQTPIADEDRKIKVLPASFSELIIGENVPKSDMDQLIFQAQKVQPEIVVKIAECTMNEVVISPYVV